MNILLKLTAASAIAAAAAGGASADVFSLGYEAPGVQHSTATFTNVGVETFDTRLSGTSFTTDFGTNGKVSATYSNVLVNNADQYGGAGGISKYVVAFSNNPYSLKLTSDATAFPKGINYFGYWLSALDAGNQVTFYNAGVQVGSLSPSDVLAKIGSNSAYFGNPNPAFKGQDASEPFVFINFFDTNGSFDEIRFTQTQGGGYESDNHTVGFFTATGSVPEPTTWGMLAAGFVLIGSGLRRRRPNSVTA